MSANNSTVDSVVGLFGHRYDDVPTAVKKGVFYLMAIGLLGQYSANLAYAGGMSPKDQLTLKEMLTQEKEAREAKQKKRHDTQIAPPQCVPEKIDYSNENTPQLLRERLNGPATQDYSTTQEQPPVDIDKDKSITEPVATPNTPKKAPAPKPKGPPAEPEPASTSVEKKDVEPVKPYQFDGKNNRAVIGLYAGPDTYGVQIGYYHQLKSLQTTDGVYRLGLGGILGLGNYDERFSSTTSDSPLTNLISGPTNFSETRRVKKQGDNEVMLLLGPDLAYKNLHITIDAGLLRQVFDIDTDYSKSKFVDGDLSSVQFDRTSSSESGIWSGIGRVSAGYIITDGFGLEGNVTFSNHEVRGGVDAFLRFGGNEIKPAQPDLRARYAPQKRFNNHR